MGVLAKRNQYPGRGGEAGYQKGVNGFPPTLPGGAMDDPPESGPAHGLRDMPRSGPTRRGGGVMRQPPQSGPQRGLMPSPGTGRLPRGVKYNVLPGLEKKPVP